MTRRQLERGEPLRGRVGPGGIERLDPNADVDTDCAVLHVDMDAFFAGVTQLAHPDSRGRPVIVGGVGPRGVVASANYTARSYGVHSAMPMATALRLCPDAIVHPPDHEAYARVSASVMAFLRSVTPHVEELSLDEAFLDVSGARRRLGTPVRIAELIRRRVRHEQGLTCSVGIARTKFVAKLAATHCKPDGLLLVPTDRVLDFLHPLPAGALWGVGDKAERRLARLGLRTIGDVAHAPPEVVRGELGVALGTHVAALAWGHDERTVVADAAERSISTERTFSGDVSDPTVVHRELLRQSQRLARRLRSGGLTARTVGVKLRRADFTTRTRSCGLTAPTDVAREIAAAARALYERSGLTREPLRLVGVRAEGLADTAHAPRQLAVDEPEAGWREAERAMDRAAQRFGPDAVRPAALAWPERVDD